jgi:hypothetical protein
MMRLSSGCSASFHVQLNTCQTEQQNVVQDGCRRCPT